MNKLSEQLSRSLGYCCPRAFVIDNAHKTNTAIAEWLGISERTVVNMRKRVRDGEWKCEEKKACMINPSQPLD